jgi:hypothetical protein
MLKGLDSRLRGNDDLPAFRRNSKLSQRNRGFLVLEILIAGLILTAGIAATMYLFRLGYGYLEKTRQSNILSARLIQASSLIKEQDLDRQSGTVEAGDGVTLKWKARLLIASLPTSGEGEFAVRSPHELRLYRVDITAQYQEIARDYQINVLRYKTLSPNQMQPF